MFKIGCQLSPAKGFLAMGKTALRIGANTFQFFTRNPRGSRARGIDESDAAALAAFAREHDFAPLMGHAPYSLNPCSSREHIRTYTRDTMADDLKRMAHFPGSRYNFHPGNHMGQGVKTAVGQIVSLLNGILTQDQEVTVLLETMSGKGTEVGGNFEELSRILEGVSLTEKMGVCLDTNHIFDAGYDIVNNLEGVLEKFDRIIGLSCLKAIHLNDSANLPGSRKDRHAKLGEGRLGMKTFAAVINHPKLRELPFYLETPNDTAGFAGEIKKLRKAYKSAREALTATI